mgnify:CR=1 FL=1
MIKFENLEVTGFVPAIRGMRNPMNSWERTDSEQFCNIEEKNGEQSADIYVEIGPNDDKLMLQLAKGGPVHAKYRRMIVVYVDIVAPLYWWKEFDTYKVGTVANSCSTMHKIAAKEFGVEDFSVEHLIKDEDICGIGLGYASKEILTGVESTEIIKLSPFEVFDLQLTMLNHVRKLYLEHKSKEYWWQMIQLLPSSYNQRRTVMMNYEVLTNIYTSRKGHKLDEWRDFCRWIEGLSYAAGVIFQEKEIANEHTV